MAKRIKIEGNALVIEDTGTGVVDLDQPAKDVYFDNELLKIGFISITYKGGVPFAEIYRNIIKRIAIADAVNYEDVAFTASTFRTFARTNLAANEGAVFVADETNMVAVYLKNNGSIDQNVDGSSTPVEFAYAPPAGYNFICSRVVFYMEDNVSFDSDLFGGRSELANGWVININDEDTILAKNNRDLATYMFDMKGNEIFGKVDKTAVGRFSFGKFVNGGGLTIRDGKSFKTIVRDDLSGLVYLELKVMGILIPSS